MESILTTIKKLLGAGEGQHFDVDIITGINTAFANLRRIGVGPSKGFRIQDNTAKWSDFIPTDDVVKFEDVKSYVYFSTKLDFDPPSNPSHLASMEKRVAKLEWSLNADAESEI